MRSYVFFALIVVFVHNADGDESTATAAAAAVPFPTSGAGGAPSPTSPPASANLTKAAAYAARELVNASIWGVISSIAYNLNNAPFGNALSYSDGASGTPYFYLSTLDNATLNYSRVDPRSSLTVSQYALGTCGDLDPQEPICVKVTLTGELEKVKPGTEEAAFANATLFDRHPRFTLVPAFGMFEIYKLVVKNIYVINTYGSPQYPSTKEYFSVKLSN